MDSTAAFLSLDQVRYQRPDQSFVLEIDHLSCQAGDQIAIVGANGSGKSTMLGLISGLLVPQAGEVLSNSSRLHQLSETARAEFRRTHVSMLMQSLDLIEYLTVSEHLQLLHWCGKIRTPLPAVQQKQALEAFDLDGMGQRRVDTLSGGQRQRLALLKALYSNSALVLLDEPTSQMDSDNAQFATQQIMSAAGTVICVTHDEALIACFPRLWRVIPRSRTFSVVEEV